MRDSELQGFFDHKANYRVHKAYMQRWGKKYYSHPTKPRYHHGLLLVLDGGITFKTRDTEFSAGCGTVIFLPKGSLYEVIFEDLYCDYLINFEIFPEPDDSLPRVPQIIAQDEDHKYIEFFASIFDSMNKYEKNKEFAMKGQFYLLIAKLLSDQSEKESKRNNLAVQNAKQLLETLPDIPVSEIAKKCGISISGLRAEFHKAYGISPVKYRTEFKISRAKYLLYTSDMAISEISEMLDFYDEAYFCKVFAKHVGCSPKEYAKTKKI